MRRPIFTGWGIFAIALMSLVAAACQRTPSQSALFEAIVQPEKGGLFRGVELGMKLEEVKKLEGAAPKHDDKYGYVYELDLPDSTKFYLEYICKDQNDRKVQGIVGNVILQWQTQGQGLYMELEEYWREKFGAPDGQTGDVTWKKPQTDMYLNLQFPEHHGHISFNFSPLSGF